MLSQIHKRNKAAMNFVFQDHEPLANVALARQKSDTLDLIDGMVEMVDVELELQRKVQEKSKEIVAIGRARVAGMVAEKYTRIGKIEALSDLKSLLLAQREIIENEK